MAFDANKPADNEYIANGPSLIRANDNDLKTGQIVDAGKLQGMTAGNGTGNIPIANGTICTNLNAEKLNGNASTAFAPIGHVGSTSGHPLATIGADGLMSSTAMSKLTGIEAGAEVNQNAFSNIIANGVTLVADGKTDTFEIIAGTAISVTGNATNDTVTIACTYSYTHPSTDGSHHVPATGTTNNLKVLKAGATAGSEAWGTATATEITNTPAGGIEAVTVQAALNELDTEKAPKANPTFTGTVSGTFSGNITGALNVINTNQCTLHNGYTGGLAYYDYTGASGAITGHVFCNGLNTGVTAPITVSRVTADVADGTAPLVITSTTKVSNLNADRVDDLHAGTTANAGTNEIVRTDGSGYVQATSFKSNATVTATAASHYFVATGSDGILRPKTLANVQAEIITSAALSSTPAVVGNANGIRITIGASAPSTPVNDKEIWYDTTEILIKIYTGSAWVSFGSAYA